MVCGTMCFFLLGSTSQSERFKKVFSSSENYGCFFTGTCKLSPLSILVFFGENLKGCTCGQDTGPSMPSGHGRPMAWEMYCMVAPPWFVSAGQGWLHNSSA